VAFRQNYK
jgi:hypothetical protein